MKSMPLVTISLVFFFLLTVSHALYIFTDLIHLHNVDEDADDDYRGTPKIQLPTQNLAAISGSVEEDEAVRFGDLAKELRHIPAAMRLFPRQCHHNPTVGSDVVEVMMRRGNGGGGLDHVTGRLRTRGGPHAVRLPGADVEERGGVMMMMLKRPHFSTPRQQAHRHETYQHREADSKRAVGKKRQDRQEEQEKKHHEKEIKETENAVLKKIRKFIANF